MTKFYFINAELNYLVNAGATFTCRAQQYCLKSTESISSRSACKHN